MIRPKIPLRPPCYDFCPVQATAIKAISAVPDPKTTDGRPRLSGSNSVPGSDGRCVQRAGT
jgi:hypothetical protein